MNVEDRMGWIERGGAMPLARQCELAGVSRASVYRRTIEREQDEEDRLLCRLIDEEYTRRHGSKTPCFGEHWASGNPP